VIFTSFTVEKFPAIPQYLEDRFQALKSTTFYGPDASRKHQKLIIVAADLPPSFTSTARLAVKLH